VTLKIQLKNSTTTKIVPSSAVLQAEVAYSFVTGDSAGGDRLYIGNAAGGVDTIGGKYYTDMMDQPKGSVVPSSAIITDANNKIDQLKVDELTIDLNKIAATGNLILDPGIGHVSVNSHKIQNVIDPVSAQDAATKNYIDTKVIATASGDTNPSGDGSVVTGENIFIKGGLGINTQRVDLAGGPQITVSLDSGQNNSFTELTVDNVKLDGNTVGTTSGNLVLDPAAIGDNTGTVIIAGDLQVDGTTTTLNSTTLTIDDKNIVLASGAANPAAADGAGITIDGASATIIYAQTTDTFNFNKKIITPDIQISGTLTAASLAGIYLGFDSDFTAKSTSDLTEGTNLYYTSTRADSAFDASFAAASTDSLSEGSTNLYYTDTRARASLSASGAISYNSSTGAFTYTQGNTDTVAEGSNLYFTDERVDDRVAALLSAAEGLDAAYNDASGVLTLSAEIATQTNKGVAAFDSVDFVVTSGQVEIRTIDCGTY